MEDSTELYPAGFHESDFSLTVDAKELQEIIARASAKVVREKQEEEAIARAQSQLVVRYMGESRFGTCSVFNSQKFESDIQAVNQLEASLVPSVQAMMDCATAYSKSIADGVPTDERYQQKETALLLEGFHANANSVDMLRAVNRLGYGFVCECDSTIVGYIYGFHAMPPDKRGVKNLAGESVHVDGKVLKLPSLAVSTSGEPEHRNTKHLATSTLAQWRTGVAKRHSELIENSDSDVLKNLPSLRRIRIGLLLKFTMLEYAERLNVLLRELDIEPLKRLKLNVGGLLWNGDTDPAYNMASIAKNMLFMNNAGNHRKYADVLAPQTDEHRELLMEWYTLEGIISEAKAKLLDQNSKLMQSNISIRSAVLAAENRVEHVRTAGYDAPKN